jgi:hypothetical protein
MERYYDIAFTPAALALQERHRSRAAYERKAGQEPAPTGLSQREVDHIIASDSFFLSSVSSTGWPYVQHRGGDAGFVAVFDPTHIGWLERPGNGQHIGTGNISADHRVALIFVDQPARTRLKLYGRATYHPEPDDRLVAAIGPGGRNLGAVTVEVVAFDWNCPKGIRQRFTTAEVAGVIGPLHQRIEELEARLAELGRSDDPPADGDGQIR